MSKSHRVMVDIETLVQAPGCAILSIGAVRFDTMVLPNYFERSISLTSCGEAGLSVDVEMLEWWLDQDAEAQHVLTGGDPLMDVLKDFADWVDGADEIWANSPSFDCAILHAAYGVVGLETPWNYYDERDVRTVRELPGNTLPA
jgi:hypothetical protein